VSSTSDRPPEFFIDRSLGKSIAEGLRAFGLTVHTMASVCRQGPFIYGVYERSIRRLWPN